MPSKEYTIANNIRARLLTGAGEVIQYTSRSDQSLVNSIRDRPKAILADSAFEPIDPNNMSKWELDQLGFMVWSKEGDEELLLIPIWLLPFLAPEVQLGCIDGSRGMVKREQIDNDHRFGMLAWGVFKPLEADVELDVHSTVCGTLPRLVASETAELFVPYRQALQLQQMLKDRSIA